MDSKGQAIIGWCSIDHQPTSMDPHHHLDNNIITRVTDSRIAKTWSHLVWLPASRLWLKDVTPNTTMSREAAIGNHSPFHLSQISLKCLHTQCPHLSPHFHHLAISRWENHHAKSTDQGHHVLPTTPWPHAWDVQLTERKQGATLGLPLNLMSLTFQW